MNTETDFDKSTIVADTQLPKIFNSFATDYMDYNGMEIMNCIPLDPSKYDIYESGPMFEVTLQTGIVIEAFHDEIADKGATLFKK